MGKNTSISLGDHFEAFVQNEVSSGRYQSASEVLRAALRLLEEREKRNEAINQALIEGEQSGFIDDFDPEAKLRELKRKYS